MALCCTLSPSPHFDGRWPRDIVPLRIINGSRSDGIPRRTEERLFIFVTFSHIPTLPFFAPRARFPSHLRRRAPEQASPRLRHQPPQGGPGAGVPPRARVPQHTGTCAPRSADWDGPALSAESKIVFQLTTIVLCILVEEWGKKGRVQGRYNVWEGETIGSSRGFLWIFRCFSTDR